MNLQQNTNMLQIKRKVAMRINKIIAKTNCIYKMCTLVFVFVSFFKTSLGKYSEFFYLSVYI